MKYTNLGRTIGDLVDDRENVVIATKCFGGTHGGRRNRHGLSRKNVVWRRSTT